MYVWIRLCVLTQLIIVLDRSAALSRTFSRLSWAGILWESGGQKWQEHKNALDAFVEGKMGVDFTLDVKKTIFNFFDVLKKRWGLAKYNKDLFLIKNRGWLSHEYSFPVSQSTPVRGRPVGDISTVKYKSKVSRTQSIRDQYSIKELSAALEVSYIKAGNKAAGKLVRKIQLNPKGAGKYRVFVRTRRKSINRVTPVAALTMFVEANLSKTDYNSIKRCGRKVFPNYNIILEEKEKVYPDCEITVREDLAECSLQGVLDKSIERQFSLLDLSNVDEEEELHCDSKWGMDGSGGLSQYAQELGLGLGGDSSIFLVAVVPLKIYTSSGTILWENPSPNSPYLCRPVKIFFAKENARQITEEQELMEEQIRTLTNTRVVIGDRTYSVKHRLDFTMCDGKVSNACSGTLSAMRCNICGLTSSDFNDKDIVAAQPPDVSRYKFGLSTLHCWIRSMEWCLHVSYRQGFKCWQARGQEHQDEVKEVKGLAQGQFWDELHLIIDRITSAGLSNNGNTARKFFLNYAHSSSILNLDLQFIYNLYIILQLLSSSRRFDVEKFREFCLKTYKLYIEKYPWYPVPTSLHKVLIHGADIVSYLDSNQSEL